MNKKKTDLRILKTRLQIKQALLTLLEKQSFDSITVSKITQEAMISRSTFYDHYSDKYELLDSIYDEVRQQLTAITEAYFSELDSKYQMELGGKILSYVLDNALLFRVLLSDAVPPRNFYQLLMEILEPRCMKYLDGHPNRYQLDNQFVSQIYSSIIYTCLQWVAKYQNPEDLSRILKLSGQIGRLFYD